MSGSVDEEVVRMRFDNNAFERGVSTTLSSLTKLKNSLTFKGSDKGLSDLENKANKFSMQNVNDQVDKAAHHWSAWRTAGLIAFATVVHRAVNAGINVVKAFTVTPLADGFRNYQNQINATKIILSNTAASGAKLKDVTKVLDDMQKYAQLTVYNFADMAKNIGTFTANGVALKPAAAAIKGIANLAALSGASSEDASRAMYQLSQAIGQGSVKLQDWNSVQNANLGTNTFKNALVNSAIAMGTLQKSAVKFTGPMKNVSIAGESFRNSLTAKPGQTGWLTSKVLTNTLSQFTGQVSKAQLITEGFTAAQADAIIKTGKMALDSATQVKTWEQLTQALKEEVAGAYAQVFKTLFGDLPNATKLFSALHTVLENLLTGPILGVNKLLEGWAKLGGRAKAIDAFKTAFAALHAVLKPIKEAFRQLFPPQTGKTLYELTVRADYFFKKLKIGADTADKIKRTFAGVFAVFDIGKQIVFGIAHVIGQLVSTLFKGSGNVLSFTAHVGDMVVAFDQALKKGDVLKNWFQILSNVLTIPINLFHTLTTFIAGVFAGFHPKDANNLNNSVAKTGDVLARVAKITQNVSDWFAKLSTKVGPAVHWVVNAMKKVGSALADVFNSQSFGNILKTIQTGLLAGIVVLFKKFLSNGLSVDVGGGFFGKMSELLEGLTGNLKAMQQELKAKALLEIAGAIGILAISMVALSAIDPQKLGVALKAMAVGFGELLGSMKILSAVTGSAGIVKLPLMAASLNLLATSILLLTGAVAIMSRMSWEQLKKGLTGVAVLLGAISVASYPLSANAPGMIRAGIGITAMAVALNLLIIPVKLFARMSWGEIGKGLGAVGIALVGIAGAMRLMPKGMVLQSVALNLIATAMNTLYLAVKHFSALSWKDMLKGLVGVAGGLVAIALGMKLMPPGILLQAAALNLIALALIQIDKAVANMAKLSWKEIAKGLAGLGGALLVLAGGLFLMEGSIGGAIALTVVAAALHIFVPALQALGSMSWGTILKGLGALAAAFGVLGLAALILSPVIPLMIGLGVALGVVGVAMLAFGAGAALLGIGLTAIAASGGAAIGVLLTGLKGIIDILPELGKNLALGLTNFVVVIGKNAPVIIGSFVKLLNALLQAVPKIMPQLITAIESLVSGFLKVLVDDGPKIVAAGFALLMDLLRGISNNIGKVVTTVVDIVVHFLDALASNIGRIVSAGVNLLFKFLEGVARAAAQIPGEVVKIIVIFVEALFSNFGKIVSAGGRLLGKLISGIFGAIGNMASAAVRVIGRFLSGIGGMFGKLLSKGAEILGKLVSGLLGAVGGAIGKVFSAGWRIASALVKGLVNGITSGASAIKSAIGVMTGQTVDATGVKFGIGGPSRVFCNIGRTVAQSLGMGIANNASYATDAANTMGQETLRAMSNTMASLSDAISNSDLNFTPTITPVLDLTQVKKDAVQLNSLATPSIIPEFSNAQAADISNAQTAAAAAADAAVNAGDVTPVVNDVKMIQNNYSPKAINTTELYRRTNNQMSLVKKALGLPTDPNS